MIYSLTDKLKFEDNPQIEINGKLLTVNADAETVLQIMDIAESSGEVEGMKKAIDLLFSKKDAQTIRSLKLNMTDFRILMETAISLAVGDDPEDNSEGEE